MLYKFVYTVRLCVFAIDVLIVMSWSGYLEEHSEVPVHSKFATFCTFLFSVRVPFVKRWMKNGEKYAVAKWKCLYDDTKRLLLWERKIVVVIYTF